MEYYTLKVCGLERKLPLSNISRKTKLASFSFLGDVELVDKLADELAKRLKDKEYDVVVGTGVKAVPLIHGVAKRIGHKRYVVCRKSIQPHMVSPIVVKPLPYFPKHVKQLVISGDDANFLKNKKIAVVDDVVSTGVTMRMMDMLMNKVGAKVAVRACVLKQGEQYDPLDDLIYLEGIEIFKEE